MTKWTVRSTFPGPPTRGTVIAGSWLASGPARHPGLRRGRSLGSGDDAADQIAGVERGEVDVAAIGHRFNRSYQGGEAMFIIVRELSGLFNGDRDEANHVAGAAAADDR